MKIIDLHISPNPVSPIVCMLTFSSVQFSCSVVSISDPMNHSMPGLPVHHQLPDFTQIHVHRVGDAIQPSHPLSSPSPAPNPSQPLKLFSNSTWGHLPIVDENSWDFSHMAVVMVRCVKKHRHLYAILCNIVKRKIPYY